MQAQTHATLATKPGEKSELGTLCISQFAIIALLCGCVTVNPRADYEQVAARVAEATGQEDVYQPGDEDVITRRVEDLLQEGISLDEAVQICLLNNLELQAAFLNVGMARADVVQAGLFSNPSLGVALRLPSGGGLANIDAGIAQNIADLWQIPVRQRAAERELDRAILDLARDASQLAAEAKVRYYASVTAKRLHEISEENLKIAEDLLDMALARQQAGAGSGIDVNLSRGTVLEAKLTVKAARLAFSEALRNLATILGLKASDDDLILTDKLPDPPDWKFPPQQFVDVALANRLDILAAQQRVMASAARLQEQWRTIFPTVELGVELERGERKKQGGRNVLADTARASIAGGGLTAPEIQPRSERRRHTDLLVGPSISLEIPIFDQNQAQIAKAEMAYRQAAKQLDALQLVAGQEVHSAADRAITAWETARFYRDSFVPLAETNLNLSRESYKAGRASFLEVLEAQRFFLDARSRYIEALHEAATVLPDLERAVGLPLTVLMSQVGEHQETTQP